MRNEEQRRRYDYDEAASGSGRQGGGEREQGRHYRAEGNFDGPREPWNQFERGAGRHGRGDRPGSPERYSRDDAVGTRMGYGGYDGEYGGYGGSREAGYGTRAGQGGQAGSQRDRNARPRSAPKGYTRSDERIREDVCEQLSRSGLDVSDVSVDVAEGRVTLEGTIADRYAKHAIEDCADACLGVKDVENRIRVQRP